MSWQFYRHMPVHDADGKRLGHTVEIGHAVDYIHVREGILLTYDWYVPITAVRDVTPDGVYLNVNRDKLRDEGWNVPTEEYLERQGATPGYEYTSPADIPSYGSREPMPDAERG